MATKWNLKGFLLGACSCDWGCPCSFNAVPTKTFCEGGYVWNVTKGEFDGISLDGLTFCWVARSPGPLHLGNVKTQVIIDERANADQRRALATLFTGKEGGPFAIFAAVTSVFYEPIYAPWQVTIKGLSSSAKVAGLCDLQLSPILNPVTGAAEELQLRKPTGFTSTWADLGKSLKFSVTTPTLSYDHSGLYGEYSEFDYKQAA